MNLSNGDFARFPHGRELAVLPVIRRMVIIAPVNLAGAAHPWPATNTQGVDLTAPEHLPGDLKTAPEPGLSGGSQAYEIARTYAERRDLPTAQSWLREALRQKPLLAPAHYLEGLIWQELGDIVAALSAMRRCVFADPSFVLGHVALARLFLQLDRPEHSLTALRNAIALLHDRAADEMITEGDGLTVRQLQKSIYALTRHALAALCPYEG